MMIWGLFSMQTKEELCHYVAGEVRRFLEDEGPCRTISYLSHKLGISFNTIKRLAQNESKFLEQDTAFSILSFFEGPVKAAKMMANAYPKWYQTYGKYHCEVESVYLDTGNHFPWSQSIVALLDQCCTPKGCSNDWIIENMGKVFGIQARDFLLSRNLIKENELGNYVTYTKEFTDPNWESLIKQIREDSRNFPAGEVGNTSFIGREVHALSNEASDKWLSLTREYLEKLKSVRIEDEKSSAPKIKLFRLNFFGYWTEIEGD